MGDPAAPLEQCELDEPVRQFVDSGKRMAVAGDARYSMRLEDRGGVLWLAIRGVVMQSVTSEFTVRLQGLVTGGSMTSILVDMRECTYLCSSALGVLAMLLHRDSAIGGKIVLLGASPKLRKMMMTIGLSDHFIQLDDEAQAARYLLQQSQPDKP